MSRNEKGFGLIEGFLVFTIVVMISFVGWFVWHKRATSPNTKTVSVASKPIVRSTATPAPTPIATTTKKYTLVTYSSANGFSMLVPKEIYDSYGACKKEPDSYRPASAWVPAKVFEGGESVYISVQYFYNLGGEVKASGISNFQSCDKVDNSLAITFDQKTNPNSNYVNFEILRLFIAPASNETDINAFLKKDIWQNYKVGKFTNSPSGDWQEVTLALIDTNDFVGQGKTVIRYYPAKHKVIAWMLGQYNHYVDPDSNDSPDYAQQMVDSFKFN